MSFGIAQMATSGSGVSMDPKLKDHLYGTLYGNCVGDAIGLLTEFMVKTEVQTYYGKQQLEYCMKVNDLHRSRWKDGDWTDDSDQMILIMQSIVDLKGKVDTKDYGPRLVDWMKNGVPECGDQGGMGIGRTTMNVLRHKDYATNPHHASEDVWRKMGECANMYPAPNGGVMRSSILGIHRFKDVQQVIENTVEICKTTHHDPRCVASCVAVTTAIAQVLQAVLSKKAIDSKAISEQSYQLASKFLETDAEKQELRTYMFPKKLRDLKLDSHGTIGYTYKTMGAGFWAFNKSGKDFRHVMEKLVREAGDADTNCAVAGALLGCKLGYRAIPDSWKNKLAYPQFLEDNITRFLETSGWDQAPDEPKEAAAQS